MDKQKLEELKAKYFPLRQCPHCKRQLHLSSYRRDDYTLRDVCNNCYVEMRKEEKDYNLPP